jgi:DNA-binding Xre family transcriptional regulator
MRLLNLPDEVAMLEMKIRDRFPAASLTVDTPADPKASWFIDINLHGHIVTLEWKHDRGFGITTNPHAGGYGEGADESYGDAEAAYERIAALLLGRANTMPPESVRLRELRAMRGISQVELAELLRVQQAAVSKLERRKDIRVSTLRAVAAAMGGELKVSVKFPDGMEKQLQFEDDLDAA